MGNLVTENSAGLVEHLMTSFRQKLHSFLWQECCENVAYLRNIYICFTLIQFIFPI